jgi:hypothetical protein
VAKLTPENHDRFLSSALQILRQVAKTPGNVVSYEELMEEMGGPGRGFIGQILEDVSVLEHREGRPLLSVLVVHKGTRNPGPGYWGATDARASGPLAGS